MSVHIVRLGSPRCRDEGVRIGTVRRPPRGVPKEEFSRRDFYDVWLPALSPSARLVDEALSARDETQWRRFVRKYRGEMKQPDAARTLDLLASLSHSADFSVGCYCPDETRCHRSILRELLIERGAKLAAPNDASASSTASGSAATGSRPAAGQPASRQSPRSGARRSSGARTRRPAPR